MDFLSDLFREYLPVCMLLVGDAIFKDTPLHDLHYPPQTREYLAGYLYSVAVMHNNIPLRKFAHAQGMKSPQEMFNGIYTRHV